MSAVPVTTKTDSGSFFSCSFDWPTYTDLKKIKDFAIPVISLAGGIYSGYLTYINPSSLPTLVLSTIFSSYGLQHLSMEMTDSKSVVWTALSVAGVALSVFSLIAASYFLVNAFIGFSAWYLLGFISHTFQGFITLSHFNALIAHDNKKVSIKSGSPLSENLNSEELNPSSQSPSSKNLNSEESNPLSQSPSSSAQPKANRLNAQPKAKPSSSKGYPNLGNTCFMNAALKTIVLNPTFTEAIKAKRSALTKEKSRLEELEANLENNEPEILHIHGRLFNLENDLALISYIDELAEEYKNEANIEKTKGLLRSIRYHEDIKAMAPLNHQADAGEFLLSVLNKVGLNTTLTNGVKTKETIIQVAEDSSVKDKCPKFEPHCLTPLGNTKQIEKERAIIRLEKEVVVIKPIALQKNRDSFLDNFLRLFSNKPALIIEKKETESEEVYKQRKQCIEKIQNGSQLKIDISELNQMIDGFKESDRRQKEKAIKDFLENQELSIRIEKYNEDIQSKFSDKLASITEKMEGDNNSIFIETSELNEMINGFKESDHSQKEKAIKNFLENQELNIRIIKSTIDVPSISIEEVLKFNFKTVYERKQRIDSERIDGFDPGIEQDILFTQSLAHDDLSQFKNFTIQLPRFDGYHGNQRKRTQKMTHVFEPFIMEFYDNKTQQVKKKKLDPISIICHQGNVAEGHYFSLIKEEDGWYIHNDSQRRKLRPEESNESSFSSEAYILNYKVEDVVDDSPQEESKAYR